MQTRIAVLDGMLTAQMRENPEPFADIELVWAGHDPDELARQLPRLRPHVIVASLDLLGDDAGATMTALEEAGGAELSIVVYHFAKRADLAELRGGSSRRRILKAPVALAQLRTQMMSLLVRNALSAVRDDDAAEGSGSLPGRDAAFSADQLGRLAEISSAIDCECPNHLADIVGSLVSFERYSANCENKNEADAAVHRMLHHETRRARTIMDAALAKLVEHEKIEL